MGSEASGSLPVTRSNETSKKSAAAGFSSVVISRRPVSHGSAPGALSVWVRAGSGRQSTAAEHTTVRVSGALTVVSERMIELPWSKPSAGCTSHFSGTPPSSCTDRGPCGQLGSRTTIGLSRNPRWISTRRQMRCIARRRCVHILDGCGRSDNAARCRSCRRAPARDYGTALTYSLHGRPAHRRRLRHSRRADRRRSGHRHPRHRGLVPGPLTHSRPRTTSGPGSPDRRTAGGSPSFPGPDVVVRRRRQGRHTRLTPPWESAPARPPATGRRSARSGRGSRTQRWTPPAGRCWLRS